jgi:hypothetical protein
MTAFERRMARVTGVIGGLAATVLGLLSYIAADYPQEGVAHAFPRGAIVQVVCQLAAAGIAWLCVVIIGQKAMAAAVGLVIATVLGFLGILLSWDNDAKLWFSGVWLFAALPLAWAAAVSFLLARPPESGA